MDNGSFVLSAIVALFCVVNCEGEHHAIGHLRAAAVVLPREAFLPRVSTGKLIIKFPIRVFSRPNEIVSFAPLNSRIDSSSAAGLVCPLSPGDCLRPGLSNWPVIRSFPDCRDDNILLLLLLLNPAFECQVMSRDVRRASTRNRICVTVSVFFVEFSFRRE